MNARNREMTGGSDYVCTSTVLFVSGVPIPRETGRYYDNQFALRSGSVLVSTLILVS